MPTRKLDLRSIEHALAVVEHLSFRRAADAIGISQSSISKRVAALEDKIGVALFERHHFGVRVTYAGQRFFDLVTAALEQLDQATLAAGEIGRVESGRLSIGILSSLASGFLPLLIKTFGVQHPDVEIIIEDCTISNSMERLRDKSLDLIFTVSSVVTSDCESQQLWNERIFIALPMGHPLCDRKTVDWSDLESEIIILNQTASWRTYYDDGLQKWASLARQLDIRRFSVARDTLMHMVALGRGVSLTSDAAVAVQFPGVVFRPLAGEGSVLDFRGTWLSQNNNQALRRLIAVARMLSKRQEC